MVNQVSSWREKSFIIAPTKWQAQSFNDAAFKPMIDENYWK